MTMKQLTLIKVMAPISSVMTLIRLSLALSRSCVMAILRLDTNELRGTAMMRTTTPAKAAHPRMLICQLTHGENCGTN